VHTWSPLGIYTFVPSAEPVAQAYIRECLVRIHMDAGSLQFFALEGHHHWKAFAFSLMHRYSSPRILLREVLDVRRHNEKFFKNFNALLSNGTLAFGFSVIFGTNGS